MAGVAKKYDVDYANLLKLCKEADVPIPSQKYWTSKKKGEVARKETLLVSTVETINIAIKNRNTENPIEQSEHIKIEDTREDPLLKKYEGRLLFMNEEDRRRVFEEAE